ncbi:MAG: AMP-binding protein [Candidatus Omnitrophota bacterium]|jgi:long-chain acyl-CoA synthetase
MILRRLYQTLLKCLLRFPFILQVEGGAYVRSKGPVILAGNRTGFLDRAVLWSAFNGPLRFIELRRGLGTSSLAVDRALRLAAQSLEEGISVCIFPQGRPRPDTGISFHHGVEKLERQARRPVIPFAIHNRGRRITVQFARPIDSEGRESGGLLAEIHERVQFMKESLERREKPRRERIFQESVLSLMLFKSDSYGSRLATCIQSGDGWRELSYLELSKKSRDLSDYMMEWGLGRTDRVSMLSESTPEWGVAYFATIRAGGVLVPLDVKLTPAEMVAILTDSAPRILFVSREFGERAVALKALVPSIESIILLGPEDPALGLPSMDTLRSSRPLRGRNRDIDETALLIYTSGTTGNPKGVMITFGNLIFQVRNFNEILNLNKNDMYLSILPLNHLFELTGGYIGVLHAGGSVCYATSLHPQEITRTMREKKVTGMMTVPLFLKLLKTGIEKELRRKSPLAQKLFRALFRFARWVPWPQGRKILFLSLHRQFGGRLRGFISGGAPLDLEVGEFFDRIGIPVYQGYGLTETSPVVSVNTPHHNRFGSVGRPLRGASVEILKKEGEPQGEILTRGPHIMKGYYKRPDLTAEVLDEHGWFHTGDLGRLDRDGYLYITGRIKNMIVLGGGKKVQPEEVEVVLSQSPLFKEVCVAGIRTKDTEEVTAAVVVTDAANEQYAGHAGELFAAVKNEISKLVRNLAHYKRPSQIFIHPEEFPKTATRKIKRPLVTQWIRAQMFPLEMSHSIK